VGTLRVTSTPSEATVYVNGERAGQTPYEDGMRTPGPVTVRLEKDGHDVWEQQAVAVAAGATREVAATLTATAAPEPGPAPVASVALRATAPPGGTVAVGAEESEGTGQFQLTPGTHTVRFTHPQYGTVDSTLTVRANTSHELTAYFEQQVNINTDGAWAGLWINGALSERTTPQQLTLGPGEHTVRARIDRTTALSIAGGLHRVEVDGVERSREEFAGTSQTIRIAPTFRPTRHVLVFRVRARE
jgi:serine/threonine-protein kinase